VNSRIRNKNRRRDKGRKNKELPTGKLARNQAISVFGIGSIYELRFTTKLGQVLNSVMIAGLDNWTEDSKLTIREPILERSLAVNRFQVPPPVEEEGQSNMHIPAVRFPEWMVCSKCERMGQVPFAFEQREYQPTCRVNNCGGRGVPARLVTACFHDPNGPEDDLQPGHIDDFPWVLWAHRGNEICSKPALKLRNTGASAGLSGLEVVCESQECQGKSRNSLAGVFGSDTLDFLKCRGKRPWLGDSEESCKRKVRVLMRGASNVYFPTVASALSIPPYSSYLLSRLGRYADILASYGEMETTQLVQLIRNADSGLKKKYSESQLEDGIVHLVEGKNELAPRTEVQQKQAERNALVQGSAEDEQHSEFEAVVLELDELDHDVGRHFDCLVRGDRLREVRALRGFSRISPAKGGDAYRTVCAPLSKDKKDWLPAIEIRGEGVYFELNTDAVIEWSSRLSVIQRHNTIEKNYKRRFGDETEDNRPPEAGYVLVHTFSHLLINALALECGYSSASLRERIYAGPPEEPYFGVLIFTGMPGADGTLGGLASQASPKNFARAVRHTLDSARWCSSDPLCIDSEGQGADALNQAACHACCLISETSCETGNLYLDRAYISGTDDSPDLSFFNN
jgi:hypothetical protein